MLPDFSQKTKTMKTLMIDIEHLPKTLDKNCSWFSFRAIIESENNVVKKHFLIRSADSKVLRAALKTCGISEEDYNTKAVDASVVLNWLGTVECDVVASENITSDLELIGMYANKYSYQRLCILDTPTRELGDGQFQTLFDAQAQRSEPQQPNMILGITAAKPKTILKQKLAPPNTQKPKQ